MREFKFRAFDKKNKEMFYASFKDIVSGIGTELPNENSHIFNYYKNEDYDREIIVMQWTGLLDKNGKEIYEGDIVRIKYPYGGNFANTVGRVFYWQEEGAFYHGNSAGRPPKRMWEYSEVIGNIFENPELIKESEL